jgi:oxygen-dependent protoporphyrinogen oxidase
LIGGIYAADAERLSLAATMPRFLEMERAGRSVIFGLRRERRRRLSGRKEGSGARWGLFVSLAGGMREIVDAIASRLDKESVRLGAEASTLAPNSGEKRWLVIGRDGRKTEADAVILALPAHASARLLAPTNPELGRELAAIPYASTAVATFAYRKKDVEGGLKSFGLLAPRREGRKIFACSFSNVKYPGRAPADGVLLRLFVGGALGPELCVKDDAEIVRIARAEIKTLLGVAAEPLFSRLDRHPDSMPQYLVGHLDRVERIFALAASHAGLALAGNGYRGVGIPDCILSGEQAAEKVWDFLRPPRALQKD